MTVGGQLGVVVSPGPALCVRVLLRVVGGGALTLLWHVALWGGRVRSARAVGLGAVLLGGAAGLC